MECNGTEHPPPPLRQAGLHTNQLSSTAPLPPREQRYTGHDEHGTHPLPGAERFAEEEGGHDDGGYGGDAADDGGRPRTQAADAFGD